MNIQVNLPPGFFKQPELQPVFDRLKKLGTLKCSSYNTPEEIGDDLSKADALLMWSWPSLSPAMLDASPKLMFRGQIDINQRDAKVALGRSVPLSVSRYGFSPAVAEMALTLVLAVLRKTSDYHAAMRISKEKWVASFPDDIDPLERQLTGRRVGIIGFGRIGQRLGELLAPFHCELRVVDPYIPEAVVKGFSATLTDLPSMLAASEIVVLCAASNDGTNKLIGAKELALMPRNAVLINVARAALVDTPALLARLKKGDLFAALDVFDQEPLDAASELRSLPNAYLTPHRAGGLIESVQRNLSWLVDDLESVLARKPRKYALTESMLPSLDA